MKVARIGALFKVMALVADYLRLRPGRPGHPLLRLRETGFTIGHQPRPLVRRQSRQPRARQMKFLARFLEAMKRQRMIEPHRPGNVLIGHSLPTEIGVRDRSRLVHGGPRLGTFVRLLRVFHERCSFKEARCAGHSANAAGGLKVRAGFAALRFLLHLLAERFKCTRRVGALKARLDMPPADPAREAQQIARLRALAAEADLDPEFAEKFLGFLVTEVIRHHDIIRRGKGAR